MDKENNEQNEANSLEQSQELQKQRRRTTTNEQKQEGEKTKTNGNSHDKNNIPDGKQLPALVLEHAGIPNGSATVPALLSIPQHNNII